MPVQVFCWDMFKQGPEGIGVGHASMMVWGKTRTSYISFWPAAHNPVAAWSSPAKVHSKSFDIQCDGQPNWRSKAINDLDEEKILAWWGKIAPAIEDYADGTLAGEVKVHRAKLYGPVQPEAEVDSKGPLSTY